MAPYTGPLSGGADDKDTPALSLLCHGKRLPQFYRGRQFVHVSDLIGKCVRKIAIMEMLDQRHPREIVWDGHGVTYAIGHAIGDYVVRRLAYAHPDKLWARWGCACGKSTHTGILEQISKTECPQCHTALDKHHEVAFADEAWLLTGSPDVLLFCSEDKTYQIVELKSMTASMFNDLGRPLPDHKVQVAFYWQILHRLGWPLKDRCSILYTNKEFSFRLPFKEFVVDPNEEGLLEPYMSVLGEFREFRSGGALPRRTFCTSMDTASAKACPVCVTCFGCER